MRYTIALSLASLFAAAPALRAEVPVVVTDIAPVQALVAGVMGDLGAPVLLLDRGADAHDFQLRPSQAAALQDAGLVVWIGPEMTPWLERGLEGAAAAQLRLLAVEGTHLQDFGAFGSTEGHDHDHDHDHAKEAKAEGHDHAKEAKADAHDHDHGHDHAKEAKAEGHDHDHAAEAGHDDHAGHDHSGTDPHAWLDPANAAVWVSAIAAELGRIDPANAATYAANADRTRQAIAAVEAEVAALLEPVHDRPFVVFHDAYGYFAGHFGLNVAASVAAGDAASPGAARLRELQAAMGDGAALCIFPEANHDPKLVAQMAEATGARLGGTLDPEGSTQEPGPDAWAGLMRGMATTLAECLGATG